MIENEWWANKNTFAHPTRLYHSRVGWVAKPTATDDKNYEYNGFLNQADFSV